MDYCEDVGNVLKNADERIWVAMYLMRYFTPGECPETLVEELIEARRRGVEVVVILNEDNYNVPAISVLRENNVAVYIYRGFMHAKLVITEDCSVVGSTNWTRNGVSRNAEASVIVCNTSVMDRVFREFLQKSYEYGEQPQEELNTA